MASKGCGCKQPTNTRVLANGTIQQSFDGGLTWEDIPDDPRNVSPVFPPLVGIPGPTLACAGAKSGAEAARLLIEQIINSEGIFSAVNSLLVFLIGFFSTFLPVVGTVIVTILAALAFFLFQLGLAAFNAEDWPTALETFKCILFCHINQDASFSGTGLGQVKADVLEQLPTIPGNTFWHFVNSLGVVGLTNVCRAFPGLAGSCDSCPCSCDNPTLGEFGENLIPRPDIGVGWWQVTTTLKGGPECIPNGCFFAEVGMPACCLHAAYQILPPGINAPAGNREAVDCNGVSGFSNYGLGGCQIAIAFRSFNAATFEFQLLDCPP